MLVGPSVKLKCETMPKREFSQVLPGAPRALLIKLDPGPSLRAKLERPHIRAICGPGQGSSGHFDAPAEPSGLERPSRAPQRSRAGSSGHFERPSGAERARCRKRRQVRCFERPRRAVKSWRVQGLISPLRKFNIRLYIFISYHPNYWPNSAMGARMSAHNFSAALPLLLCRVDSPL